MEEMSRPILYRAAATEDDDRDTASSPSSAGSARRARTSQSNESSPIIPREDSAAGRSLRSIASLPDGQLSEQQSVRLNVAQTVAAPAVEGSRSRNVLLYAQTVLQFPPAVAACVVVPMSLAEGESCDLPLALWAALYAIALALSLFAAWTSHLEPTERLEDMSGARRFAETIRKPLENFTLGWLIMGQIWVQSAEECVDSSPMLFALCFWLVVLGFTYNLLPCIIIILALPFLCFCLPCVIRVLARLAGSEPFRGKGASERVIEQLPCKQYHPGLFEDEAEPQCSICLSQYEDQQELRILPCDGRHHFHKECVDEWLRVNGSCPICRASVTPDAERASGESSTGRSADNGLAERLDAGEQV